jgi:hypothetical protein
VTGYGPPESTVRCRAMNCGQVLRSQAVPAAKVLGPGARGWFCRPCADARKEWTRRTVRCRTMNCGQVLRSGAVPAAKVLGPGARGWFCRPCADKRKEWTR